MKYGWIKDAEDPRDLKYKVHKFSLAEAKPVLPRKIDLRKNMPPVFDQGELGSCHDDKTEVLTELGWSFFKDLTGYEKLATVNPETAELIYEKPSRLVKFPYLGNMVCYKTDSLDFKVTPDHTMLVRKWDDTKRTLTDQYSFVAAKDLGWYAGLMNRIKWSGCGSETYTLPGVDHKHTPQKNPREIAMSIWMRFLGIYIAEGTMLKRDQNQDRISYKIQIAGSKPREKNFIRQVLSDLGVKALELTDRFTFENKQVYEAMESLDLLGVKAPQKFVPNMVFQQSAENIREFLLGHFMGDGCAQANSECHYTSSFRLSEDLQRLIFLSGNASRITVREAKPAMMTGTGRVIQGNYPEHRVSVRKQTNLSIERKKNLYTEKYAGTVYCAEVPTYHTLVTRRNGSILISGNCTGNAISGGLGYLRYKDPSLDDWSPSRLYIYYHERALENSVNEDNGAMIRTGIKVVGKMGAPPESLWPYDLAKWKNDPPSDIDVEAHKYLALTYYRVDWTNLNEVKGCLAAEFPIVFGFQVYTNIQKLGPNADLSMPNLHKDRPEGGHAVLLCGYDDDKKLFLVRNSWGADWGEKGYFWMPYDYITDPQLSDDFWTIRATT